MQYAISLETSGSGYVGHLYAKTSGATSFTEITLPTGVVSARVRPSRLRYQKRNYLLGVFSRTLVYDEDKGLWTAGIAGPTDVPTVAGSGSGSVTGEIIGYVTFAHVAANGKVIHESNPSKPSATASLAAQNCAWSGLPTTSPDSRVTHIRLYRRVDGRLPRLAGMLAIGASTFTENLTYNALSFNPELPAKLNSAGEPMLDEFARGVPPYSAFGVVWDDRGWYFDPKVPGGLYSKRFEMESVNPSHVVLTKDGEFPTGAAALDDELLIFCHRCVYAVRPTGDPVLPYAIRKISNAYGTISHWSIVTIQGVTFFASMQGVSGYFGGGQFRNLMARSYRKTWTSRYKAASAPYDNCFAAEDYENGCYLLGVSLSSEPKTLIYRGYYRPMIEEGALEPYWSEDIQNRQTESMGELFGAGENRGFLAFGGCDGYARKYDDTDDDDDGDTYLKHLRIQTKHFLYGDHGGDDQHARTLKALDVFAKNESTALTVNAYGGDEEAATAAAAPDARTISAQAGGSGFVPKTSHHLTQMMVAGKGHTIEVEADSPVGVEYRGVNLYRTEEGQQSRLSLT